MSTEGPQLLRRGGGGVASRMGLGLWKEESQGRSPTHAGARVGAGVPAAVPAVSSPSALGLQESGRTRPAARDAETLPHSQWEPVRSTSHTLAIEQPGSHPQQVLTHPSRAASWMPPVKDRKCT